MTLLNSLRKAGLSVEAVRDAPATTGVRADAVMCVEGCPFVVEERGRVPYPSELDRLEVLRARFAEVGTPLMVVPFVSDEVGNSLRRAGWSWADDAGNFDLRAAGLVLRQRTTNTSPPVKSTALPQGSGSLAIIRSLIGFSDDETEEAGATTLAAQANVSQPRASQVLSQLHRYGLVARTGHGRWLPDRAAMLDRLLSEYRGPGGSERYLYSLDPLTDVAVSLATAAPAGSVAVSADVGPDLIRAWRRPTMLIVYVRDAIDPWTTSGLVDAQGRDDANVIVRSPRDTSVFPRHQLLADVHGVEVPLADPTQMIWDLHQLGGQDRLEAAEVMREWVLSDHP
jgi:hypothetical protein